ncbi:MAG: type II toxin-antitoxin system prevent-host-death family antitoxin [Hyphomicrobiales bacterium]|nr:type II toxin-antitoxin system prevent-host-death family antitoxin [Hyphomicrobiales bacterium]
MNITVAEMKANLSEILRKAAAGEEITVTKHGKPYAKVGPDKTDKAALPRIGAFKDHDFWMADDFNELGPEWDEYTK